jgi:hypothetical protein
LASSDYVVSRAELLVTNEDDLLTIFPLLNGETKSAWCVVDNHPPILKSFETIWMKRNSKTK